MVSISAAPILRVATVSYFTHVYIHVFRTPISQPDYLVEQNRKSWSETPTEVKDVYGDEYFDAFIDNIALQMQRAKSNVGEVVDLMVDAVTDDRPKIRYVPASSRIRATILSCLPSSITDKLFNAYQPKSKPRLSSSSSVSDADSIHK